MNCDPMCDSLLGRRTRPTSMNRHSSSNSMHSERAHLELSLHHGTNPENISLKPSTRRLRKREWSFNSRRWLRCLCADCEGTSRQRGRRLPQGFRANSTSPSRLYSGLSYCSTSNCLGQWMRYVLYTRLCGSLSIQQGRSCWEEK